jgi:3-oxoacyl-[acyl-carrier protein] reductase
MNAAQPRLEPQVRIVSSRPSAALVSTVPVKRLATPEEIAHVIAFVSSANASYMTGASVPVDGGMLAD